MSVVKDKIKAQTRNLKLWLLLWQKLSFNKYKNDVSKNSLYGALILIAVFTLFQKPIKKLLNSVLVDPIISFCSESFGADLVFASLIIFSICFLTHKVRRHLVPTLNSVIFSIAVLVVYFTFFKTSGEYKFYHFTKFANEFTYLSSFILSLLVIFISYKSYLKPLHKNPSRYSLHDDFPSVNKYKDLYGRAGYASALASHISGTTSETSFAVGIIGNWGSGKSDFMLRLREELNKDTENLTCDFNPWRVSNTNAIIEEFFNILSKQLRPYNQSISHIIKDYSHRVLQTAEDPHYKFAGSLLGDIFDGGDIQEEYEKINETIKSTAKRIVVFIDDMDRLSGKEVMGVLRIIRNTANFTNTFFVVGIDQKYIVDVLKNTKDFSNEEEYLKKVFQLTISLPAFKKDIFINEIKRYLFTPDLEDVYKQRLNFALSNIGVDAEDVMDDWFFPSFNHEFLFEKMIDNLRDLKRFCNSFKIVFNILKDEADISDLVVLELIRNRNSFVFDKLRNRSILMLDPDDKNKLKLNEEEWKKIENLIPEDDRFKLLHAIDFLFVDRPMKNQRKIVLAHNFYIYFSYQLFNLISFHDFNNAMSLRIDEMVKVFEKWITEGKEQELSKVFEYIEDFSNSDELKRVIIALSCLESPNTNWFEIAMHLLLENWKYNHERYFGSDDTRHKEFFCSLFKEDRIDLFKRASIANKLMRGLETSDKKYENIFFGRKEIRNVIYVLFDQYLLSHPDDPLKTLNFYRMNFFRVVYGKVEFFPPASRRFKNYLLKNEDGFKGYVKTTLVPSQQPYNNHFVMEPWLEKIFGSWVAFKEKLVNTEFKETEYQELKRIILEHIEQHFESDREPIYISNVNDKKFIEKFLSLDV